MKAILVGAGGVSRELLKRLGERWVLSVVDVSAEALERAEALRPVRCITGDGSSRVVLKRAGLEGADAVIAATNDDETNIEVCRLAREAGVRRLAAVVNEVERVPDYRELGILLVSPDSLTARRIEVSLETRRVSSMAFADGRAEAIEFRLAADSPVCGKPLRELHAHSWIVGAILREGSLIIPHGETVFEAGDLVTVVGAGADFAGIVRTFTSGQGRFPLDFGKRVAVAVDTPADLAPAREALALVRGSRASSLLLVHRDPATIREESRADELRALLEQAATLEEGVEVRTRAVAGRAASALASIPRGESVGTIVIPSASGRGMRSWSRVFHALRTIRRTGCPVLVSRGSHPYRRILVPARRTRAGRAAIRAAIDLSRFTKSELVGIAVVDPIFISGPGAPLEAEQSIAWLEEEAAVQGVTVEGLVRRGNPIRVMSEVGRDCDLLVLGASTRRRPWSPRQGIAGFVARAATRSVLLVPV